jgi:Ni2+-binding GTPase involved in maturation of urease and hydrogenase
MVEGVSTLEMFSWSVESDVLSVEDGGIDFPFTQQQAVTEASVYVVSVYMT